MLCIVEGPDCAGKSTLVDRLRAELGQLDPGAAVDVIHRGPPTRHPLDEYALGLLDYRPGRREHVLCDRWHWGEAVYPAVVGRVTQLDDAVWLHVELVLRSRGALVVHCTASTAYLTSCLAGRGDPVVRPDQAAALRTGFAAVEARTLLPVQRVVVDALADAHIADVLSDARLLERAAASLNPFVTYVGPPAPTLLLLGDRRGPTRVPLRQFGALPAFVPRAATSGHWLLTALARHAPDAVRSIGLANACDVDDAEELWRTLGKPSTVALGRNAAAAASFADRTVAHPQWARRFQHHASADYVRELLGNA